MPLSWDELQTIECLLRTGSIAAAGRSLGLTHTSVSRRIDAMERTLGAPLFVRGVRLTPTPLAEAIAARTGRMALEAADVEALVEDTRRARERRLVVTTNDVLAPVLFAALAQRGPSTAQVEVRVGDAEEPLVPGLTDLALRPSHEPSGALRGWKLGRLVIGVFAPAGLKTTRWIQPTDALRQRSSMRWWKHVPPEAESQLRCDSLVGMRDACAAGLGRAALPVVLGRGDRRLRLEHTLDEGVTAWLLASATRRRDAQLQRDGAELAACLRAVL